MFDPARMARARGAKVARAVGAPLAIGLDVGGTKILSGLVERDGTILETHEIETPDASEAELLGALDAAVEKLVDDRVVAIGYGVPANLERRTRKIVYAVNLPLTDVDLVQRSRDRFSLPVGLENDASAATLAEWKLGAGRGTSNLVMLTLGTGIGGGVVVDGRLLQTWTEMGHIVVQEGGPECPCGGRGHLEALASGSAGDRAARDLYGPDGDAHRLVDRAQAGDTDAVTALATIGKSLGAGVSSLVAIFDPEVVAIGGGFGTAAGELILGPAEAAAREDVISPADRTLRLVPAELGEEAGLVGAALVAFEALDGAG